MGLLGLDNIFSFWDELPMPVRWFLYTLFMGYLLLKRRAQMEDPEEPRFAAEDHEN